MPNIEWWWRQGCDRSPTKCRSTLPWRFCRFWSKHKGSNAACMWVEGAKLLHAWVGGWSTLYSPPFSAMVGNKASKVEWRRKVERWVGNMASGGSVDPPLSQKFSKFWAKLLSRFYLKRGKVGSNLNKQNAKWKCKKGKCNWKSNMG